MPVHSVELRHLVLLNVNVQDTGASFLLDNKSTRLFIWCFRIQAQ